MNDNTAYKNFPVVGIGASAGGLEAIEGFFGKIPDEPQMAFVIIQHLDPHHDSVMSQLLEKYTDLTIEVISQGGSIQPGHVYLNPPDKNVAIENGVFHLSEISEEHKGFFRIDHFFRSLAKDQAHNAICIVLSGTGSDGTIGLREVKSAGGLTMAQEETEAGYESMPKSAIHTGLVDIVLSTEKIAEALVEYVRHPYMEVVQNGSREMKVKEGTLSEIFQILHHHTGHDFSNYKVNTIYRRIERRMAVHQIGLLEEYARYLQAHTSEVEVLFKELLISITSFFRDPEAFEALKNEVLPSIVKKLAEDETLRVWVPGCATGEETYTIAILLQEAMEEQERWIDCKIFSSDIDKAAVEFARHGLYPESIASDISALRLQRFFTKTGNQYQVKKHLREMVVFAEQNLIKDPPFSNIDLISCRNVLIYMNQNMQHRLISVFHYALNHYGYLFLGSSESITGFESQFKRVNNSDQFFQKASENLSNVTDLPSISRANKEIAKEPRNLNPTSRKPDTRSAAEKVILDNFTYPCVIVNSDYDILFLYGDTEKYLTVAQGKASLNLLNMARASLQYKIIPTLRESSQNGTRASYEDLQLNTNAGNLYFDLIVEPIEGTKEGKPYFLVVFQERLYRSDAAMPSENNTSQDRDKQMIEMEKALQATIQQLEISNEELQSRNEELQATNEELQSSIEELETSKEEAQSTNEELISVNAELKQKINDLAEVNNDINNLLASTDIATIFLDSNLAIKRFTPASRKIFNLIDSDIGRPINDITANIHYQSLSFDASHVLNSLKILEKEIHADDGNWYAIKIMPYRTTENIIDGVVITFFDVTANKASKASRQMASTVRDAINAMTVIDLDGTIIAWNKAAENLYGYTEAEILHENLQELIPKDENFKISDVVDSVKAKQQLSPFQTKRYTKSGKVLSVWLVVNPLINSENRIYAIATTEYQVN